ncbi:hypothetical protein A9K65_008420 [Mesorhizobium sp. WSM1497]|uniref:aromatic ring-hydroxylating oxygenase subunit alpha n=1 Tax=Mesorhizobium sp. WSM1497 TaxID=278153 RepID=UPI0007ECC78D|nr:aromatic ring-hydroxylating dioxygenase subunit alpha [Mesorhizobium sp. WSM1497]ARP63396.1 hypothetical protein A9K65_008420 [Mesorhizobium sp. WSM1497]
MDNPVIDADTASSWHAVSACEDLIRSGKVDTRLLGQQICVEHVKDQRFRASTKAVGGSAGHGQGRDLPLLSRYGFIWVCMGAPAADLFELKEYALPGRRNVNAGTFGVRVSAARAVENFLDMGHFAFVHPGYLGDEPFTEIVEYNVEVTGDQREILATECKSFRSRRSDADTAGSNIVYTYRVMSPFCSLLTMPSQVDPSQSDVVAIFAQPMEQESCRVHMLLSVVDNLNNDGSIRRFQQTIFGQDKPILENQVPRRLPLDPRSETPIRADKSGIVYRRWLQQKGVTFGVIPAGS